MALLHFKFGNFRSFKQDYGFTLEATDSSTLDENRYFHEKPSIHSLNSAVIFGANASGKTNFLFAIQSMNDIVRGSLKRYEGNKLPIEPFLLDIETQNEPSFFEVTILMNGRQYRYGFEATKHKIEAEWLFLIQDSEEILLFSRDLETTEINPLEFKEAEIVKDLVPDNALLLAETARLKTNKLSHAKAVMNFFLRLHTLEGTSFHSAVQIFNNSSLAERICLLIQRLDLGITNIFAEKMHPEVLSFLQKENPNEKDFDYFRIKTKHKLFKDGTAIKDMTFDMDHHESKGTRKLFSMASPILEVLEKGMLLLIDEFDASLHPELAYALIKLFHSAETNPFGAQLIIVSNNINLLDSELFRHDQIWFVEKTTKEESTLFPLTDFSIPKDTNISEKYSNGRFGAVPYLYLQKLHDIFAHQSLTGEK